MCCRAPRGGSSILIGSFARAQHVSQEGNSASRAAAGQGEGEGEGERERERERERESPLLHYTTARTSTPTNTYLQLLRRRQPQLVRERVSERRRQLALLLSIRTRLGQPHPRRTPIDYRHRSAAVSVRQPGARYDLAVPELEEGCGIKRIMYLTIAPAAVAQSRWMSWRSGINPAGMRMRGPLLRSRNKMMLRCDCACAARVKS